MNAEALFKFTYAFRGIDFCEGRAGLCREGMVRLLTYFKRRKRKIERKCCENDNHFFDSEDYFFDSELKLFEFELSFLIFEPKLFEFEPGFFDSEPKLFEFEPKLFEFEPKLFQFELSFFEFELQLLHLNITFARLNFNFWKVIQRGVKESIEFALLRIKREIYRNRLMCLGYVGNLLRYPQKDEVMEWAHTICPYAKIPMHLPLRAWPMQIYHRTRRSVAQLNKFIN